MLDTSSPSSLAYLSASWPWADLRSSTTATTSSYHETIRYRLSQTYLVHRIFADSRNKTSQWYVCSRTTVSLNYNYPEQCQITLTLTLQLTNPCGSSFHPIFHMPITSQVPCTQLSRRRRSHGYGCNGGKHRRRVLRTTLVLGHSNDVARSRRGACSTSADDLLESSRAGKVVLSGDRREVLTGSSGQDRNTNAVFFQVANVQTRSTWQSDHLTLGGG